MQHHTRERLKRVDAHRVQEWRERKRRLAEEACGRGGLLRAERIKAMFHLGTSSLTHLLVTYGYGAVLLFVAIESTGIPFPGETMLLLAAIASGTTHQLSIAMVIVAAASG